MSPAQLVEEPDLSAMRPPAAVACLLSVSDGVGVGDDESCLLMRTMPIKASDQQRPSKNSRAIIKPKVMFKLSSTMKVVMLTASSNVERVRRGMLIRQSCRSPGCHGISSRSN